MILKSKRKIIIIFTIIFVVISILLLVGIFVFKSPMVKYNQALRLIEKGETEKAYKILYPLGDYKDNIKIMEKFTHYHTMEYTKDGETYNQIQFTYYENGIVKEKLEIDGDGRETKKTYFNNGNLESEVYYDYSDNKIEKKYDINKNIVESKTFMTDGAIIIDTYEYDSNGKLIKKTSVNNDSKPNVIYYEYDNHGRLIKKAPELFPEFFTEYVYDERGNFIKTIDERGLCIYEAFYDERNNLIEEKSYLDFGGDLHLHFEYEYDENDNLIKVKDKDGGLLEGEYDSNGNLTKVISGSVDSEYETITEIFYDNSKNIIKITNFTTDDGEIVDTSNDLCTVRKPTRYSGFTDKPVTEKFESNILFLVTSNSTKEYTYNSDGNVLKEIITDSRGNNSIIEYFYDEDGKLLKQVSTKNEKKSFLVEFIYDEYGNLTKEVWSDSNGEVSLEKEYTDFIGIYNIK